MRVGIDYRFIAGGPYQVSRGMGRFTQQQLREVLRADGASEYVLCCPAGGDQALIHPEIAAAPNVSVRFLPAGVCPAPGHDGSADGLERAERFTAWAEAAEFDVFHATTPMLASEPVLTCFDACPLVATLYDLIPLVFPDQYFNGTVDTDRYLRAVGLLMKADRLIAISGSARDDAFRYLGVAPERIDVASPFVDPTLRPLDEPDAERVLRRFRAALGLPGGYVFSVTHFHHSKNVELLLGAYARLEPALRSRLPLLLCCEVDEGTRQRLLATTAALGVAGQVMVSGMVTDEELAALYSRASVVVHPSRYEGFGLPVAEAMRCGAPVITTTASSLPEVGGDAVRLVDPDDERALAAAIAELAGAGAGGEREEMIRRGRVQAERYSGERLGRATLACYRKAAAASTVPAGRERRPRLAMWTPVPPQQSGIADYSAELVDELAASCDIELFVDGGFTPDLALSQRFPVHHHSAFARRHRRHPFDVTVYQMGNSHFHWYMYEALRRHPGVVALHDMAWSQVVYAERNHRDELPAFVAELAASEGDDVARRFTEFDRFVPHVRDRARLEYLVHHPMLGALVDRSLAQVVLLDACRDELAERFPNARVRVVPMGVADPYRARPAAEVGTARARLRLPPASFVIGTFGIVHPFKRVEACLRALVTVAVAVPDVVLLVVGRMASAEYEAHLRDLAARLGVDGHVRFAGHAARDEFDAHMIASDVVVNLRTPTHQHMSAVLWRAAAAAKPVVLSDLRGWAFLSEPCFLKVPVDDTEVEVLASALVKLGTDPALRDRLARAARARFERGGTSRQMADGYLRTVREVLRDRAATVAPAIPVGAR